MRNPRISNPWIAALLAWALTTGLVGGGFIIWEYSQHEPIRWDLIGQVALLAAAIALFRGWRDRGRKE
jgi:hypothetical protein